MLTNDLLFNQPVIAMAIISILFKPSFALTPLTSAITGGLISL